VSTAFQQLLNQRLTKQKSAGNYRTLRAATHLVDFCSNDYLGLARSEELHKDIYHALNASSASQRNGSTGSRLLSGNSTEAEQLEQQLAAFFNAPASLVLPSGYQANLAVLSCLPQRGDTILYDEAAHASIKDGARLSLAQRYSFKHNDLNDLEKKLRNIAGTKWIVVESIYSMDGDECPLQEVAALAQQFGALVILDEAHSTGIMGPGGAGMAVGIGVAHQLAVRIHTFGKALGCHGACVVGSFDLREYLINFARPFIYSTAPPPHYYASISQAIRFLSRNEHLTHDLFQRVRLFEKSCGRPSNNTPIQTVILGGNNQTKVAASGLQAQGFDVRPILSPTVKVGSERLRICLHAYNTKEEVKHLCDALKQFI
jgi:8-amino-7-oxononanoate synthase